MVRRKKKSAKNASQQKHPRAGLTFELAVTRIQQLLDPAAKVTHNEFLTDRLGNRRQFDTVVRGSVGGWPILGVLECRDKAKRIGPEAVEAFVLKSANIHANFRIMVSRSGFTDSALRIAKDAGIGTLSLLANDTSTKDLSFAVYCYGRLWSWQRISLQCEWICHDGTAGGAAVDQITRNGLPLENFFKRQLTTEYINEPPGDLALEYAFDPPLDVLVAGKKCSLRVATLRASCMVENKRTSIPFSGVGFLDWQSCAPKLPKGAPFSMQFTPDVENWETIDTEIPPLQPYQMMIERRAGLIKLSEPFPDLAPHCSVGRLSDVPR